MKTLFVQTGKKSSHFRTMLIYGLILFAFLVKGQSPNTFTATNFQVTDTLSNLNIINAEAITASDTIRAKDHIVAEQNLQVQGDINLAGKMFFANNSGLKVVAPNTLTGNGRIIVLGNTISPPSGDDPSACVINTNGWLTPGTGVGFFTSYNIGLFKSTLSMLVENNGNGYIDMGGSLNGSSAGDLFINQKCIRNTKINLNGGAVFMGDQVKMNKYVEVGPPGGATTGFGSPLFKVNINAGTAMEVSANSSNIKSYSILNLNNGSTYPYTVFGDGRVQLLAGQSNVRMFGVGDINTLTNPERFSVFGDGRVQLIASQGNNKMLSVEDLNAVNNPERFTVYGDGTTHIGILKPLLTGPHANAKLAVDGKILAKSVYVNISNTVWPDYVFEKNYKLMSLKDVEAFINTNKFLPNLPSAKDLTAKDDFNLSLSDMQRLQMEKIEELFLYLINQEKEIEKLKKRNFELEEKMKKF